MNAELLKLIDEYEAKRSELFAGEAAAPSIMAIITIVIPIVLRVLQGGKLDLPSIVAVVLEALPILFPGIPPELLALARTILEMLLK